MKNDLTFVIFTFNEEIRIQYLIRNFIKYGDIVIIDNYSSDNTKKISEELGAKVYEYKNNGYVETKDELKFVKSKIKSSYMTWSFADHMWPKSLLEKAVSITKEGLYDGITAIQKNYHYGINSLTFSTYGMFGKYGSNLGRIIIAKKDCFYISGMIHSSLRNNCKSIYNMPKDENFFYHHLSLYNVKKCEMGFSLYSDIESKMLFEAGKKNSVIRVLAKIGYYFFQYFFLHGAWRNGKAGFIMVMQFMFLFFNVWAKQWELENDITLKSIEKNYNKIRDDILKKI